MPIEKRPKNPLPKNYKPPNSTPYKVRDGDNWWSVAKANNMPVWDLIVANYKTRNPAEVNWYLRENVGCVQSTRDGNNWTFTSRANPGIIHIPLRVIKTPPMTIPGNVPAKKSTLWAGLGKSHSGDLFVIGAHDLTAKIYNIGDDTSKVRNAWLNINGFKFGPGLGASIGAVFVIAHGYENAAQMNGVSGGWDFDLAIYTKLGDFLKGIKGLGKAVDTLDKFKKLRYLTENAIKNAGITKKGVYTLPIPFAGAGIHIWGGYKFGDVSVFSTGEGVP
ncbi:hypothetical protein CA13_08620 [Planctomycetes bacterium CA13]|uniref:LysM domain-containing protein n=1 Tax=Novipirellula herctigrandis TaxID=2527986 RepID=A0A5C5YXP2_9BACT|nr:hypothetical protein CA13_08620 [Planctomycetes bacterium CA13]